MKVLTSRVVLCTIVSVFTIGFSALADNTIPVADFKTVTSKAYVDSLISNNDISGHKINGAPLSNSASYFYGEGVGGANVETKTASIPSITGTPAVGQVIIVRPATTNTSSTIKINLNNTTAYSVLYRGSSSNIPSDVWTAYVPSIFVLDETSGGTKYWRYVGTSPAAMTWGSTEATAVNAYSTTFDGTTNAWPVADENKYVKGDSLANALALKQNRIATNLVSFNDTLNSATYNVPALVSYGTGTNNADGILGNKIGIVGYENIGEDLADYTGVGMDNYVPTVYAVAAALSTIWNGMPSQWQALYWDSNTFPAAIDTYSTTFDTTSTHVNGNWPYQGGTKLVNANTFANSLARKQNKIPAGTTPENLNTNGSVLTYTDSAGTVGERHIILGQAFLDMLYYDQVLPNEYTNMLVDANTVANGLVAKQDKLPTLFTSTTNPGSMASTGGQTIDLTATQGNVGRRYITAGGSQPLTQKSGADNVILYINGTKTLAQYQTSNFGGTGNSATTNQNHIKEALVSLELLKDVYGELNSKITNNALPTGTTGTVVTYNGTNPQTGVQQFTETAIADAPDYTNGNLTNGDSLPSVEYVEDALATKQPIIQPSTVNGKTQIVVKPAYGGNAGEIGYLTLDTSSLTTGNDSTVPSSKFLNTLLGGKYDTDYILDTGETDIYASDYGGAPSWATTSGTANLYRIPAAVNVDNWASKVLSAWSSEQNVPTMDTLAYSLAGLYDAVGVSVEDRILNYDETGYSIGGASVPVPSQIEYTGESKLDDGNQLFWLPQLQGAGVEEATRLLKIYSADKIVPTMDELAYALDGVLQTHETTSEWKTAANYYGGLSPEALYILKDMILNGDSNASRFNNSGYLRTFAPSLEALMDESYELAQLIQGKQNKLSGTNGNLVTYGATAGATGSKEIATTITNNANTVPNTAAVYNAVNARQNVIPIAGKYRSSNTATTDTTISDWTATNIKGTALVTKPTTTNGVVGERKIFETGTTYTNDAATNIQIATIGAVMENTVTKRCVGYKPGTLPANENASTCWLWEFVSNSVTCAATGDRCRDGSDCCSGNCVNGLCSAVAVNGGATEFGGDKSNP